MIGRHTTVLRGEHARPLISVDQPASLWSKIIDSLEGRR